MPIKFKIYREYGSLNSPKVFDAVERGLRAKGHVIVDRDEDVSVIWSVLWQGRMAGNYQVYRRAMQENRPTMIVEVGTLKRNITWKISLDNVNGLGYFGHTVDLDATRPAKLGINLQTEYPHRRKDILIACQHEQSLQWSLQPSMREWVEQTVEILKKNTSKRIVVRPHPRSLFVAKIPGVVMEHPKKIPNTYDDYNIFYGYHCVINFNSGPATQAAIKGIPVICDLSSLAYPVSCKLEDIEDPKLPNRDQWFLELCHTEWTVEEISAGIPFSRLLPEIVRRLS